MSIGVIAFLCSLFVCNTIFSGLLFGGKCAKSRDLEKKCTYYIDENGIGFECDADKAFRSWVNFISVQETRSYYFFDRPSITIVMHKKYLSQETIDGIRHILLNAPIPKKKLLRN